MNQGILNKMTSGDTITQGDVWRNTKWMSRKTIKFYKQPTFLDVIIKRACSIVKKHVTRPHYSSETVENIKVLVNELNRLKTAVERGEATRSKEGK